MQKLALVFFKKILEFNGEVRISAKTLKENKNNWEIF